MSTNVPTTVAYGDGIGSEIREASLHIAQEAGARIDLEVIEMGERVYLRGNGSGIEPSSWEWLRHTQAFYKIRGVKVWPDDRSETPLRDAYRCRFTSSNGGTTSQGLEIVKTETLRTYNGTAGNTRSQGQ